MGLDATNTVFGVSEKVRFKPAFSATETSYKIGISLVANQDTILSNKRITIALIQGPKDRFTRAEAYLMLC